ncbi:hypothetical protein [Halomicrobium salinisoli]|uniref:hypothetical protein n=1 Tax=Halomicrobium salinisoli TaxID=2878391 RepID=UPI001CF04F77|nr:hypothetical protein [Halomicrobium salinisoli]
MATRSLTGADRDGTDEETDAERASRWSRRFVLAGAAFLVCWQAAAVAGAGRRAGVSLGVLGFVFHTIFGKAYSLLPTYFDRTLATTRTMPLQFALTVPGAALLAVGAAASVPLAGTAGAALWVAGVAVFLGTLLWTVRGNLSGRETGTGEAKAHLRPTDRIANAAVPVALAYLAVGSWGVLAGRGPVPPLLGGYPPRVTHLLAAGGAALVLFAVGFRLLPRFLAVAPSRRLAVTVLPAGAVGPALLAAGLPAGPLFRLGAAVEAVAVVGFAAGYAALFARSDNDRVGFYGVLAGAGAGVLAALLGISFAVAGIDPALAAAHYRLNVLGLLGLSIVGVSYQFYPPAVGRFRGAGDRTALAAIGLVAAGLLVEVAGLAVGVGPAAVTGRVLALVGAAVHLYLLAGLFRQRYG